MSSKKILSDLVLKLLILFVIKNIWCFISKNWYLKKTYCLWSPFLTKCSECYLHRRKFWTNYLIINDKQYLHSAFTNWNALRKSCSNCWGIEAFKESEEKDLANGLANYSQRCLYCSSSFRRGLLNTLIVWRPPILA